jgi:hypothetical protein
MVARELSTPKGCLVAAAMTLAFELLVWGRPVSQDTAARIVDRVILVFLLKPVLLRYAGRAPLPLCKMTLLLVCSVGVRVVNKRIRF